MSKCTATQITEAAREHQGDALEAESPLSFSTAAQQQQKQREDSPLLKALRTHFERYQGLTEPRIKYEGQIDCLRPQTDDL